MKENAEQNPNKIMEVKRVIAEGDLVVIHSHVRQNPNVLGAVVVHIFRFENDRIVDLVSRSLKNRRISMECYKRRI